MTTGGRFGFKFLDQIFLGLMRRVNTKVRQIKKERFIFVPPNKILRFVRQKIREILAFGIIGLRIGFEIEMKARAFDRFIESAFRRMMRGVISQMPFAKHRRRVSGSFQRIRESDFIQRKLRHIINRSQWTALPIEAINAADRVNSGARHVLSRSVEPRVTADNSARQRVHR